MDIIARLTRPNLISTTVLDLTEPILSSIFDMVVEMDPPRLGKRRHAHSGWIAISWVCVRFRDIMLAKKELYARHYALFPGAQPCTETWILKLDA